MKLASIIEWDFEKGFSGITWEGMLILAIFPSNCNLLCCILPCPPNCFGGSSDLHELLFRESQELQ